MIMNQSVNRIEVNLAEFIRSGLDLKSHLANYLKSSVKDIESMLPDSSYDLAALHPGSFKTVEATTSFYEQEVGSAHLLELAAWHLSSVDYIADTLRLQKMFAKGQVLDFGGGIGTHALFAAAMPKVDHVWFVDLNPENRKFVEQRSKLLGLDQRMSFHRDLESIKGITFDTLVCFDVLEHISNPSEQLMKFFESLSSEAIALMNWYFFKGFNGEYPFHFDDHEMIENFFKTLQLNFIEVFHPYLITARAYMPIKN